MKEYFKVQTVLDDRAAKEYTAFYFNEPHMSLFRSLAHYMRIGIPILLGIVFFSALIMQITEGFTASFFCITVFLLTIFFVVPWYAKQKMCEDLLLRQRETRAVFFETHVLVQGGQFRDTIQYEDIKSCYETNRFFYFYTKSKKGYILSKTHFLVGDLKRFYDFFSDKTGLSFQGKQKGAMITPFSMLTKEEGVWIYKVLHPDFVRNALGVRIRPFGGQLWYNGESLRKSSLYLNDNALHSRGVKLERNWFSLAPVFLRIDKEVFQITRQPTAAERGAYSFAVFFLCFCLLAIGFCFVRSESFIQQVMLGTGAVTFLMMGILYFWIIRNWLLMRYAPFLKFYVAICGYGVVLLSAVAAGVAVQILLESYCSAGWKWV